MKNELQLPNSHKHSKNFCAHIFPIHSVPLFAAVNNFFLNKIMG